MESLATEYRNLMVDASREPLRKDIYEELGSNLSLFDFIKIRFLLFDLLPREEGLLPSHQRINGFNDAALTPGFKLKLLIENGIISSSANPKEESLNLIKQLFFLIKKFKLLKVLNSCKHLLAGEIKWLINPFRRSLFKICEELSRDDLQFLSNSLYPGVNFYCAEDLFQELCNNGNTGEKLFEKLEGPFNAMERNDLKDIINDYYKETGYYDLTPSSPELKCGFVLIINQFRFDKDPQNGENRILENRKGTEFDKEKMKKLWTKFNFHVEVEEDLKKDQMMEVLQNFARNERNKNYKCFIVCIFTHGAEDSVYCSDRKRVPLNDIYSLFGEKSNSMSGKPKLFFIQACQGDRTQYGPHAAPSLPETRTVVTDSNRPLEAEDTALYADIFTGISSVPGFVSFRDENSGSIYIGILTDILNENGHCQDLASLMTRVNRKMNEQKLKMPNEKFDCRQMCSLKSQLRFKIRFILNS